MEASPPGQGSPLSSLLPSTSVPESMTIRKYFLSCPRQSRGDIWAGTPLCVLLPVRRLYGARDKAEWVSRGVKRVRDSGSPRPGSHGTPGCARCTGHASGARCPGLEGDLLLFRVLGHASWKAVSYRGTVLVGFPLSP